MEALLFIAVAVLAVAGRLLWFRYCDRQLSKRPNKELYVYGRAWLEDKKLPANQRKYCSTCNVALPECDGCRWLGMKLPSGDQGVYCSKSCLDRMEGWTWDEQEHRWKTPS